jgi:hypothetical protein
VEVNKMPRSVVVTESAYSSCDGAEVAAAVALVVNVVVPPGYMVENFPAVIVDAASKQAVSDVTETLYEPMTAARPAES